MSEIMKIIDERETKKKTNKQANKDKKEQGGDRSSSERVRAK